jgi:2-methylisocitrate lyase-like PEP mutase family enzyme
MMRQGRGMADGLIHNSAGARFRAALAAEKPLQVAGAINAYTARLAEATGFRAIYLSGGGVAANSLGIPTWASAPWKTCSPTSAALPTHVPCRLLVDIDTGWGGAFNIARTIRSDDQGRRGRVHIEDQVSAKRCGHRPGKELVPSEEMVDRIKAAVDARTDPHFVIMARTDALAGEGLNRAIERAQAYVAAGADMIFAEAVTEARRCTPHFAKPSACPFWPTSPSSADAALHARRTGSGGRRHHPLLLRRVSRHECRRAEGLRGDSRGGNAEERAAADANPRRAVSLSRLPRLRAEADELFAKGKQSQSRHSRMDSLI